ncbi:phospholipase D-like protein [Scopulibacillus darangshiensis]|uniref:phospholipase D n=1 Tax=Scopulibacillus darangshiensis TaxID=442528 RepID=A0A4R2NPS1_9BACL|nr:phospholipase D-like domain-containing protein [Scopulibacillus darangshiensis]TCP23747.1 phospholipase D-like protein [Scopulibacillus darangshiensis]
MDLFVWVGSVLAAGATTYMVSNFQQGKKKSLKSPNVIREKEIDYSFTRSDKYQSPQLKISGLIDQTKETLDIAIFLITKTKIIPRIIQAKKRGVDVRVITDRGQSTQYSKKAIDNLVDDGIPVKVNNHQGNMHLKLMIADNKVVCSGSYNFTKSAEEKNDEMIVIIKSKEIANEWTRRYDQMWNDEINFSYYKNNELQKHA